MKMETMTITMHGSRSAKTPVKRRPLTPRERQEIRATAMKNIARWALVKLMHLALGACLACGAFYVTFEVLLWMFVNFA